MGYCIFTLLFKDGTKQVYQTGNAIDFVPMPQEKVLSDIIDVLPHEGSNDPNSINGLRYFWCLFSKVQD